MQVEETEFYRTRNGNVLGPFTHKPHIGWIVPGLRVSWDNDGRLRRSTIEEHPLDLIAPATIVEASLAPLEERPCEMSLSFPGTVSREQVERMRKQIDDTVLRRRAEMTDTSIPEGVFFNKANGRFMNLNGEMMPIDFYLRWIGRNHLFPATYEDAWDAIAGPATEKKPKVNEALGEPYIPAAEQMRNYIDAGRWIDGKPLDTMKPGICRFLEEIGTTNALGDLIGVMQTNAYSLTAQYKRAGKAGVICVEVELPKAITVDVAR